MSNDDEDAAAVKYMNNLWWLCGELYWDHKNYEQVLRVINGSKATPSDSMIWQLKALAFLQLERYDEAYSTMSEWEQQVEGPLGEFLTPPLDIFMGNYETSLGNHEKARVWYSAIKPETVKGKNKMKEKKSGHRRQKGVVDGTARHDDTSEPESDGDGDTDGYDRALQSNPYTVFSQTHQSTKTEMEEKPSSTTRVDIKFSSDIVIVPKFDDFVYKGIVSNSCGVREISFIRSNVNQSHSLQLLQALRGGSGSLRGNGYILQVDSVVQPNCLKEQFFLVCEEVESLNSYFTTLSSSFKLKRRTLTHEHKKEWWVEIEAVFSQIFRDLIQGLRYIFSNNMFVGNLSKSIFLTPDREVKVLPSLKKLRNVVDGQAEDIHQLVDFMKMVIALPFKDKTNSLRGYDLPSELMHFFDFIRPQKLDFVAGEWLLLHPWVLSPLQRFECIQDLKYLFKKGVIKEDLLNGILKNGGQYCNPNTFKSTWQLKIEANGPYRQIFDYPTTCTVPEYKTSVDIYRYMLAVLDHINDVVYVKKRLKQERYTRAEVEEHFRHLFPDLYTVLFSALFNYAKIHNKNTVDHEFELGNLEKADHRFSAAYPYKRHGTIEQKGQTDGDDDEDGGGFDVTDVYDGPWKFSVSSNIVIEDIDSKFDELIYVGSLSSSLNVLKKSFIEANVNQCSGLPLLLSLGRNNSILSVDSVVQIKDKYFLVCEEVVTLENYFRSLSLSFIDKKSNLQDKHKQQWWIKIADSFNDIFRDLIRGLRYLFSNQKSCGRLSKSIFLTPDGKVKILPSLGENVVDGQVEDIKQLKDLMKKIIGLPFEEEKSLLFYQYDLPEELKEFFSFAHEDNLEIVPAEWLVDFPWPWFSLERFEFIRNLKYFLKLDAIKEEKLNTILVISETYWAKDGKCSTWQSSIKDEGRYKKILQFASNDDSEAYNRPIGIQKYMNSVWEHINDREYMVNTTDKEIYNRVQVEERLRQFFPDVYANLFRGLFKYAKQFMRDTEHFKASAIYQLSSRL